MENVVYRAAALVALCLDAIAVLLVAAGAAIAVADIGRACLQHPTDRVRGRMIYIDMARWLAGALTFQLGSDIVSTTVAPTWSELGRVAAVATIRILLTYFLDRDLERARTEVARHDPPDATVVDCDATKVQ